MSGAQVCFKPGIGSTAGCRALTRPSLDRMCSRAKCTILHQISNDYLDAYVLSESSLFVYPHKVHTCVSFTWAARNTNQEDDVRKAPAVSLD